VDFAQKVTVADRVLLLRSVRYHTFQLVKPPCGSVGDDHPQHQLRGASLTSEQRRKIEKEASELSAPTRGALCRLSNAQHGELDGVSDEASFAWNGSARKFECLKRVAPTIDVPQLPSSCRNETEPRIVARLAKHHDEAGSCISTAIQSGAHESLRYAVPAVVSADCERSETHAARYAVHGNRTERDVPDHIVLLHTDE
jgi:hypothetical protein